MQEDITYPAPIINSWSKMKASNQNIIEFFNRKGWSCYEQQEENESYIITEFQSSSGYFELAVFPNDDWISFVILDFLPLQIPPHLYETISKYLLELNCKYCVSVRFGIIEDGYITLTADMLTTKNFYYEIFDATLEIIGHYAETYYPILFKKLKGDEFLVSNEEKD